VYISKEWIPSSSWNRMLKIIPLKRVVKGHPLNHFGVNKWESTRTHFFLFYSLSFLHGDRWTLQVKLNNNDPCGFLSWVLRLILSTLKRSSLSLSIPLCMYVHYTCESQVEKYGRVQVAKIIIKDYKLVRQLLCFSTEFSGEILHLKIRQTHS